MVESENKDIEESGAEVDRRDVRSLVGNFPIITGKFERTHS